MITLIDDTFDGNKATGMTGAGGALAYLNAAAAGSLIENVTIAHNTAPVGGGIYNPIYAGGIENTIVAENSDTGSVGGAADCYGVSVNNNGPDEAAGADLGGNVDSDGTCFSPAASRDLTSTDPKLAVLGDNGGQTPTDALLAGSPAIGHALSSAATCSSADQRGVTRLSGFCDPGAYQTIDADLTLAGSGPSTAKTAQQFTDTFTVSNGGPYAAAGVTFTDPVPAGTTATATASTGSCTVTSAVTCSLGTLGSALTGGAQTATVTVKLTPGRAGTVSNQASVSASSLDPNAANNSATVNTVLTGKPVNTALPRSPARPFRDEMITATTGSWQNDRPSSTYSGRTAKPTSTRAPNRGATAKTYRPTSVRSVPRGCHRHRHQRGRIAHATSALDRQGDLRHRPAISSAGRRRTGPRSVCPSTAHRSIIELCELSILLTALGGSPGHLADAVTAATCAPRQPPRQGRRPGHREGQDPTRPPQDGPDHAQPCRPAAVAKYHRLKVKLVPSPRAAAPAHPDDHLHSQPPEQAQAQLSRRGPGAAGPWRSSLVCV